MATIPAKDVDLYRVVLTTVPTTDVDLYRVVMAS